MMSLLINGCNNSSFIIRKNGGARKVKVQIIIPPKAVRNTDNYQVELLLILETLGNSTMNRFLKDILKDQHNF